jgi:hypothetical protein
MQILEPSPTVSPGFVPKVPGVASAGSHTHTDDPRWQLALRIAASGSLGRSQLLSGFLLYIVDRSIRGRTDEISEQQIGVIVFGRARDYDSNDDNIVRSYARKLRKRIDEYFVTEGREEILRLEIPRGGYTPIFSRNISVQLDAEGSVASPSATAPEEPVVVGIGARTLFVPRAWNTIRKQFTPGVTIALLVGIVVGVSAMFLRYTRPVLTREEAVSHFFWKQLFSSDRDTFIVPSDDGLVIMQRLTERPVPLSSYVNGTYRTRIKTNNEANDSEILKLGGRRYTSVVDLDLTARLSQLREVVPERMMIRYARDLRMDDLRTGNAILIGSDEANPWIELFRSQLHFSFQFEPDPKKQSGFANLYPRSGEKAIYSTNGQEEHTYGIIAYLPNLSNNGHVLIVAGLNTAGTQAASAFLLDPSLMMPILQRARGANGTLQSFELLISAANVATNAAPSHLVLERIGLPQAH